MMTRRHAEHWRDETRATHAALPTSLRPWLWERRSLTRKLRAHCAGRVTVRVLSHRWDWVAPSERAALHMGWRERGFVRQVELYCADAPVIFARTVIPAATVAARGRLTRLGNRALGDVLFADRGVRRDTVRVARLTPRHPALRSARSLNAPVWGRRSRFTLGHAALLVSEFFLTVP